MTLRDLINKLLGRQANSAGMARQRLQLVLAHDRSDLNPELLEQMRREILEVVSRYVEIDLEGGDVSLATEDRVTALVANLPIRRTRPLAEIGQGPAAGEVALEPTSGESDAAGAGSHPSGSETESDHPLEV
ncbi:MAG: cell division topological specificity factor MinE [Cyanobium sp.]|nr:cell division topological specificity factor MinE [Cyanobium sp.]